MSPAIRDGEIVHVRPAVPGDLRKGDLVLIKVEGRICLHRLVVADAKRDVFIARGDCGLQNDPAVSGDGNSGGRRVQGSASGAERSPGEVQGSSLDA